MTTATTTTKTLVTKVGYMIGIKKEILEANYDSETLEQLFNNRDMTVVRYLSKIRSGLMLYFKRVDDALVHEMRNLDRQEWFDKQNLDQLREWGIPILKANYRAEDYSRLINDLISNKIDVCKQYFYDWERFDLIRTLFKIPKFTRNEVLIREFNKYMGNLDCYPYQQYIYMANPIDYGNILYNDEKFMKILYEINGETFEDSSRCRDAHIEVKQTIKDFLTVNTSTCFVCDCENVSVVSMLAMLQSLDDESLSKVKKIVLYDDVNTTEAWDWLSDFVQCPVEHVEVARVVDHKSLVDQAMCMGVSRDFYKGGIKSFCLFTSDSDCWPIISFLEQEGADFMVLYEREKCGSAIKKALEEHEYYYFCLDDFCTGQTETFQKKVLFHLLERRLPDMSELNGKAIANSIYKESRIDASEKEVQLFFQKYIKSLRVIVSDDGSFKWDFAR